VIGALRILALIVGGAVIWIVAASQVPSHERLPISGVVEGAVVTQRFGCTGFELEPYDPFCAGHHIHTGIDLAAPVGTPVNSASAGTAHVGFDPNGAGLFVLVTVDQHVRIFYCHLSAAGVVNGQTVTAGQVIGALGQSGKATGPHVHFEVQVDGTSVDPVVWLGS
jgi:murein DD-endopeptidase MepM/ murein hydrolase activator NlpD